MGRWKLVERHLNEVLQDGLQANMTRTLEGLGHAVKWTRKQDGTLIANVGPVDGVGPSHRIKVPARFYEAGDLSRQRWAFAMRIWPSTEPMPRKSLTGRAAYQREYRARQAGSETPAP